jgi:hypothetical protein
MQFKSEKNNNKYQSVNTEYSESIKFLTPKYLKSWIYKLQLQ